MNREIQFRAWDKQEGRMLTGSNQYGPDEPDAVYRESSAGAYTRLWEALARFAESDRFTLMQFTGLHDKNGEEIWEGDIVAMFGGSQKSEVFWEGGCWMIIAQVSGSYPGADTLLMNHSNIVDVIGNVFENPDLLK